MIALQIFTINLGKASRTSGWEKYFVEKYPKIFDPVQDIKIFAVQEAQGTRDAVFKALRGRLSPSYDLYVKYYGSFLTPSYFVHVMVAIKKGAKLRKPVFHAWKHNLFGSKSTVAVMFKEPKIQINVSHLPFDSYSSRIDAMKGVIRKTLNIWKPDVMIWAGDLNFRIERSKDQIYDAVKALGTPFEIVPLEDVINPTCKLREKRKKECPVMKNLGTNSTCYDASRVPSYCDRVLYYPKNLVQVHRIETLPPEYPLLLSDHLPVVVDLKILRDLSGSE